MMLQCLAWLFLAAIAETKRVAHFRDYFYVGQSYVPSGNSSIAAGQVYVEHLTPAAGPVRPIPLLFVHGAGMTGTNFLNTPDGREGWADWFMSKGYEIYLVDQPSRGRSPWQKAVDGNQISFDTFTIESRFTAPSRFGLWPNASLHTQWPGNGSEGDVTFDGFYASIGPAVSNQGSWSLMTITVPLLSDDIETANKVQHALAQLLDIIGPVVLITHSQSGLFGWPLADARPALVKAIITLEPGGPPFMGDIFTPNDFVRPYGLTSIPLTFSPPISDPNQLQTVNVSGLPGYTCMQQKPPARQLPNLKDIPVLTVTAETGYHGIFDECTVQFLEEAGVTVDFVKLQDVGIHGNGHMFFMEKNNLEIAEKVVERWIANNVNVRIHSCIT